MKINLRKIASVLTSTVMLGSTVAMAAAANYPAPFVQGGAADVAVVYGANAAITDVAAVVDITADLQAKLAAQTATTGGASTGTVTGEAYALFTSSSPLLLNKTLNSVKESVTSSDLPIVLAEGTFEGDVSATYEQKLIMGNTPVVKYAKQPTDDDDPQVGLTIDTAPTDHYVYNATVKFDQNVNFTHADSIGEELTMFGQRYTVSGATTSSKLVLLKSSEALALSSDTAPTGTVTVEGKQYTIELIAASDTAATIKVTDSSGNSESKEVDETKSKKIQGIEVGIETADENNFRLTASLLIGSQRVTLQDGTAVKLGSDEDLIDGTNVEFESTGGTATAYTGNISKIYFQPAAEDQDIDGIIPGKSFVDPIFGTIKVDFAGLTYSGENDRESIVVSNDGNDKMKVKFQSLKGTEAQSVTYIYNKTDSQAVSMDLADGEGDTFVVAEMGLVNKSGYVVLANDDEGGLFEITQLSNSSSATPSDDEITIKNVFTGDSLSAKASSEGSGTIDAVGKSFTYTYYGASTISNSKAMRVRFNQPETSGNDMLLFPTIVTKKGAKVAFYEPTTIVVNNWDGTGAHLANVSNVQLPDGDGYSPVSFTAAGGITNWTLGGGASGTINTTLTDGISSTTATIGKLTYNFTSSGTTQQVKIYIVSPQGGNVARPGLIILEEKDDANNYEGLIVSTDAGYDGDSAGIGVSDVIRTVENDAGANFGNEIQHETDTDLYSDIDLWGAISTLDKSDSDQTTATISYPDDQVTAEVYVGEVASSITVGTSTGGSVSVLGSVAVSDAESSSVSTKNLIVVGGSCINSVAASLLGGAYCSADFTTNTGVGAGQFLIQTFSRTGTKVATLVAGYNAGDTTNAAKYLTTKTVDTTVGKKYKGTSATTAELVTTA